MSLLYLTTGVEDSEGTQRPRQNSGIQFVVRSWRWWRGTHVSVVMEIVEWEGTCAVMEIGV